MNNYVCLLLLKLAALRGSYHYAELVDSCSEFTGITAVDAFSKNFINNKERHKIHEILLNSGNYDVGLIYSNEDFRRWINIVHGISLSQEILANNDKNAGKAFLIRIITTLSFGQ